MDHLAELLKSGFRPIRDTLANTQLMALRNAFRAGYIAGDASEGDLREVSDEQFVEETDEMADAWIAECQARDKP